MVQGAYSHATNTHKPVEIKQKPAYAFLISIPWKDHIDGRMFVPRTCSEEHLK